MMLSVLVRTAGRAAAVATLAIGFGGATALLDIVRTVYAGALPFGEGDRRLVRQTAEHDVRHLPELLRHRTLERRHPVAVYRRPPRRHPIHELATVYQPDAHAARAGDRQHRQRIHAGRIGFRKVGRHHRVPATAIQSFRDRQREEGAATITALGELANRVGQLD